MCGIDIDDVGPSHGARAAIAGAEDEGLQVAPLFQIQWVHLIARGTKERIAAGKW